MQKLDCGAIKNNLQNFPNIIHFRNEWLEEQCASGPPYHLLLMWLSKIAPPEQIKELIHNSLSEEDRDERKLKMENLRRMLRALTSVNHVESCLGFFSRENEQGK